MNVVELGRISCYNNDEYCYSIGGHKLDRVTQSFIDEFKNNNELDIADASILFEQFVNYCVVCKENGAEYIDLDDIQTGECTQGIDGIAIIVNGKLVNTINDIENLIKTNKTLDVKFVLIQAKTSDNFDNSEILNFINFSRLFFCPPSETSIFKTDEMQKFIELKDFVYSNSKHMKDKNPELFMYFVTAGNWQDDANLTALIEQDKKTLKQTNLFSEIRFFPCGAAEIQALYRRTQSDLSATFKFEKSITMFSNENGEIGYYGILPFGEYRKIILDDGDVLKPVFEDNIRDFLGTNVDVNSAIEETINNRDRFAFAMLNNGVTVVADSVSAAGDVITINNYQIVNGCQSSHMLYQNKDKSDINNIMVPIRIIVTKDSKLRDDITKATNNQTAIKKEQLEALSTFQKGLEEYYKTFPKDDERLYYERRTGQYRNTAVPLAKMVSIPIQIKTITAMFLNNPHGVSGQYGTIAKAVGSKIFKDTDKQIMYYTSSLALYRIESLFKTGVLDRKFRKARYHAMMLLRVAISGKDIPKFNQKKMEKYCQQILDVLNDRDKCILVFSQILSYIEKYQEQIKFSDRKAFERKEATDILYDNSMELIESIKAELSLP